MFAFAGSQYQLGQRFLSDVAVALNAGTISQLVMRALSIGRCRVEPVGRDLSKEAYKDQQGRIVDRLLQSVVWVGATNGQASVL